MNLKLDILYVVEIVTYVNKNNKNNCRTTFCCMFIVLFHNSVNT